MNSKKEKIIIKGKEKVISGTIIILNMKVIAVKIETCH